MQNLYLIQNISIISTCHFEHSEKSCQSIAKISLPAFSRIRNDNDSEYEFFKAVTFIVFLRKLPFSLYQFSCPL